MYCLYHQSGKNQRARNNNNSNYQHVVLVVLHSVLQLLITANIPSSLILSTLIMDVIHSSETSVLTRTLWHHIPEDGILQELIKWVKCLVHENFCAVRFEME
jgi:hypothetical protein